MNPQEQDYTLPENWHEAAGLFPLMSDDELQKLADDIKANGQKNPIILINDKILDGRNRLLACKIAGVRPDFQSRNPEKLGSPVAWVLSHNLHRRHLTATQRAFIAVEAEKLFAKELQEKEHARKTQSTEEKIPHSSNERRSPQARDQAAKAFDVNPRYVSDAKKIAAESPETAAAAKAGKVSMTEAKRAVQSSEPDSRRMSVGWNGYHQTEFTLESLATLKVGDVLFCYRGKGRPMLQTIGRITAKRITTRAGICSSEELEQCTFSGNDGFPTEGNCFMRCWDMVAVRVATDGDRTLVAEYDAAEAEKQSLQHPEPAPRLEPQEPTEPISPPPAPAASDDPVEQIHQLVMERIC